MEACLFDDKTSSDACNHGTVHADAIIECMGIVLQMLQVLYGFSKKRDQSVPLCSTLSCILLAVAEVLVMLTSSCLDAMHRHIHLPIEASKHVWHAAGSVVCRFC